MIKTLKELLDENRGSVGPQGPQGAQGAQGVPGLPGDPGEPGEPGEHGLNSVTLTLYKRSNNTLVKSDCPVSVVYSFPNITYSGNMNGWASTIPAYTSEPVWTIQCSVSSINENITITQSMWTVPNKTVIDGVSKFKSTVFKRCVGKPDKPSPSEGSYANPIPANWSDSVPPAEGRNLLIPVWLTSRTFASNGENDPTWSDVVPANDTNDIDREWNSHWGTIEEAISYPPKRTSPIDTGTPGQPDANYWYDEPIVNARFMAVREIKDGAYPEGSSWKITQIGGENGVNTASLTLYQRSENAPTVKPGNVYYNFKTRKYSSNPDGTGDPSLNEWKTELPTYDWRKAWCIQVSVSSIDAYVKIESSAWSWPPVQVFVDGKNGISRFKSTVFKRVVNKPNVPRDAEGSYENPVPPGWYDSVPDGSSVIPVWMTSRTFVSTGKIEDGQDASWSPVVCSNDSEFVDYEWNKYWETLELAKLNPPERTTPLDKGLKNPDDSSWWDNPIPDARYMAARQVSKGVYVGNWEITEIKGEHGKSKVDLALYQRSFDTPTVKPDDLNYNIETNIYDPSTALKSWRTDIVPHSFDWSPLWVITAHKSLVGNVNDVSVYTADWSEPIICAVDGSTGPEGDSYEYLYGRAETEIPIDASVLEVESKRQKSQPDYMPKMRFMFAGKEPLDVSTTIAAQGVDASAMYEFVSTRRRHNNVWGPYSKPGLCSNWVHAGLTPKELEDIKQQVKAAVEEDISDIRRDLNTAKLDIEDASIRLHDLDGVVTGIDTSVHSITETAVFKNNDGDSYVGTLIVRGIDASKGTIEDWAGHVADDKITVYSKIVDASFGTVSERLTTMDSSVTTSFTTIQTNLDAHEGTIDLLAAHQGEQDASISGAEIKINGLDASIKLAATKSYVDGSLNNVRAEYSAGDASVKAQAMTSVYEARYISKLHSDGKTYLVDSSNYCLYYYKNGDEKIRLYSNELTPVTSVGKLYTDERYKNVWNSEGRKYYPAIHPDDITVGIPINESMSFIRQLSNEVNIAAIDGSAAAQIMVKASADEGTDIVLNADRIHLKGDTTAEKAAIETAWIDKAKITKADIQDGSIHNVEIEIANIHDASIHDCEIQTVYIHDASVEDASIIRGSIAYAQMYDSSIKHVEVQDASISKGTIKEVYINDASIVDASIIKGTISEAGIWDANIHNGTIDNAKITKGSINDASINRGNINDASINRGNIKYANIDYGTITQATIERVSINKAGITNSSMVSSTINYANINDASIARGTIDKAYIKDGNIANCRIYNVNNTSAYYSNFAEINNKEFKYVTDSRCINPYFDDNSVENGYTLIDKSGFVECGQGNWGTFMYKKEYGTPITYTNNYKISRYGKYTIDIKNLSAGKYGSNGLSDGDPISLNIELSQNRVNYIRNTKDMIRCVPGAYSETTMFDTSVSSITRYDKLQMWRGTYEEFENLADNEKTDVPGGLCSRYEYLIATTMPAIILNATLSQVNNYIKNLDKSRAYILEPTVVNEYVWDNEMIIYNGTYEQFMINTQAHNIKKYYVLRPDDVFYDKYNHIMRYRTAYDVDKDADYKERWVDEGYSSDVETQIDNINTTDWHRIIYYDVSTSMWAYDDSNLAYTTKYDKFTNDDIPDIECKNTENFNVIYGWEGEDNGWMEMCTYVPRNGAQFMKYYSDSELNRLYFLADYYDNRPGKDPNTLFSDLLSDKCAVRHPSGLTIEGPVIKNTSAERSLDYSYITEPSVTMTWQKYQFPVNGISYKFWTNKNFYYTTYKATGIEICRGLTEIGTIGIMTSTGIKGGNSSDDLFGDLLQNMPTDALSYAQFNIISSKRINSSTSYNVGLIISNYCDTTLEELDKIGSIDVYKYIIILAAAEGSIHTAEFDVNSSKWIATQWPL